MNKFSVGIIGNGFVGEAQAFAFSSISNVKIFDVNPKKSMNSIDEVHSCDFVFICVPTPMNKDGSQNLSYVQEVFKNSNEKPIYILKSTVLPGTTNDIINLNKGIKIIFSPEFLTERTSKLDMLTQSRIILGGSSNLTSKARKLYEERFKNKNIIETNSVTAELVKYMNNTFFATKVSIMNEFKLISEKVGANWEDALHGFSSDGRVGDSHLNVPGHDGKLGYGGNCFPKDVNALIHFAKNLDIDLNTIIGGWNTNVDVREEKEWEL